MGRPKSKKRSKRYFTSITEIAINAYNGCDDTRLKNKIYNRFIHYPFDKLAENVIHTYKTYYFDVPYEDVKANVVSFLNEKIHKFKGENGRAFSYFTVIARNWLFNENNANYARMKTRDDTDKIDLQRNITNEIWDEKHYEMQKDFMDYFVTYLDYNIFDLFDKDRDRKIADALTEIFRTRNNLYSYNKKALYILIRERTGVQTQYITKVVNRMKIIYGNLYTDYCNSTSLSITHRLQEFK